LIVALAAAIAAQALPSRGADVADIGSRREVFADRHLIGSLDGASRRLAPMGSSSASTGPGRGATADT